MKIFCILQKKYNLFLDDIMASVETIDKEIKKNIKDELNMNCEIPTPQLCTNNWFKSTNLKSSVPKKCYDPDEE